MIASKTQTPENFRLVNKNKDEPSTLKHQKRRNRNFFYSRYASYCHIQHITPNTTVKERAEKNILDVNGDRLKIDELTVIIEALKHDRTLHFIAFRSRYPSTQVLEDANSEAKARAITRGPVLLTKYMLVLLLESLVQCLKVSTSITCIELDGLPLRNLMPILYMGLSINISLQTISFCNCHIGDEECKQLCAILCSKPSILHLDLSNCDLGVESSIAIAAALKNQYLQHSDELWKQSLRYCESDVKSMPGLRRIILNNNMRIGDEGVKKLTEVLKEDMLLKALDLQNCNVGNEGAQSILEILGINKTLCIVDVRYNADIDEEKLHEIMMKLSQNGTNKNAHEFNWIVPKHQLLSSSTLMPRLHSDQNSENSS